MPSLVEVLEQTGFTKEQISALDPKLVTVFTGVLTEAEQKSTAAAAAAQKAEADKIAWEKAKADAELLQRSNSDFYETKIVPGLTDWQADQVRLQTDLANAKALAAFYKEQNDGARAAGFVPTDAPNFVPPVATPPPASGTRDGQGRFVAAVPGATPGSPTFTIDDVRNELGRDLGTVANIQWKYQSLYGKPMPISPTDLLRQAEANKFKDPATYANQIFKFTEKEEEMRQAAAKEHDQQVAAAAAAEKEAEWKAKLEAREVEIAAEKKRIAESGGNNPDVHTPPGSARIAEIKRAVDKGDRPNPLKMTDAERRAATRTAIHAEIEQRESAVA